MDGDLEQLFEDDDEDIENQFLKGSEPTKEQVVYLVDASPKMFRRLTESGGVGEDSHFSFVVGCIAQALKATIINSSYDEVAICFFNTREQNNLQNSNSVYVFNVSDRENLDRPTARLIKEFSHIEETFMKSIGSQCGIMSDTLDNSLFNALWVAQALLRKGSSKNSDKRILLFTNEDDPFSNIRGTAKADMTRMTIQRAKDAQDVGISIELLPLSRADEVFNVSLFYSDLLALEGQDISEFMPLAAEKFEDMSQKLRKRMFKKRKVRRITFKLTNDISIEVNTYALIRPALPGRITWLDSVTNLPLKPERSYVCNDTGALIEEPVKRFYTYKNDNIIFTVEELSGLKHISTGHLRLHGFKPLSCLKDYHNLRPSTFLFPSDEEIIGSTCVFIALHRSMINLERFAVAFYGPSSHPQLVALVAQDEITSSNGQVEPPGMHMIYLPYSDDIRDVEEFHAATSSVPRPLIEQNGKAKAVVKRIDLNDFSVYQFANPAIQTHYAVLEALALGEDEMPEVKDETWPDEAGLSRPEITKLVDDWKTAVYGENYDMEEAAKAMPSEASKKRKAITDHAAERCSKFNWEVLADSGKLKNLTVVELKYYLQAHNLHVAGNKDALISRILSHMGK